MENLRDCDDAPLGFTESAWRYYFLITIEWAMKELERVMGIEPNEHRIPRSQGKYSYHTEHSENPERPNSPYVSLLLVCGILRFCETQCFLVELERTVGMEYGSPELL